MQLSISLNVIFEGMQIEISKNRHPSFLPHDRSWCLVPSARLIPEEKTKWRDVLLLGVAVSLFMLLVSLMIRLVCTKLSKARCRVCNCVHSLCFPSPRAHRVFDSSCCVFFRRNPLRTRAVFFLSFLSLLLRLNPFF